MKKLVAASGAAFVLLAVFLLTPSGVKATAYTKIYSSWIQGSLIDSTPIGETTPAYGSFSQLSASSGSLSGIGATNFSIVGSTINSTPIGATSASTGAFTSLAVTGLGASTNALCTTTGGLITNSGCASTTLRDYYWTATNPCSSGTGQPVPCELSGNAILATTLPGAMPDANYEINCTADVYTFSGSPPSFVCGMSTNNAGTYALPTTSGGTLNYQVIQILQNGGGGGSPVVYFHAHHN